MQNENKIIWITIAIAVIGVLGVFIALVVSEPKELSKDEINAVLNREDSYSEGSNDAPVTMVIFEDFQCPACYQFKPVVDQLQEEYVNDLKFVFKHLPLVTIHANAQKTSEAAEAAGAQGKFFEMYDVLYDKQIEWEDLDSNALVDKLVEYAQLAGVEDLEKFRNELEEGKYTSKVVRDVDDAQSLGINSTPTVFINGEKISSISYEFIKNKIEAAKN